MAGTFVIQDNLYSFYFHRSFLYFSFPVVRCTRYNLMKKCQSPGECYWFSLCTYMFHFTWPVVLDATLWNKVCQSPKECYWFSLCTYIFHFPWSVVLDVNLWNKVCQSPEECYLFSLCTYIFHFPWSGVLDATLKKNVSVTCGMLLDFSVHLYFSLPMIRCTR